MALFTAELQGVNMTGTLFIDDPALSTGSTNEFTVTNGDNLEWTFADGTNIERDEGEDGFVPVSGTFTRSEHRIGSNALFEIVDIPDADAVAAWNLFHAGDSLGLFALMLSGNDSIDGHVTEIDRLYGFDGRDTMDGRGGNDTLRGGADSDKLFGRVGADRLEGGRGRDELAGGGGDDLFVFNTPSTNATADTILDFARGADLIVLENAVFDELHPGSLPAFRFVSGFNIGPGDSTAGIERGDRVLYDRDSGSLYYDANGSAPGQRVLIATVLDGEGQPVRNLGPSDFLVI